MIVPVTVYGSKWPRPKTGSTVRIGMVTQTWAVNLVDILAMVFGAEEYEDGVTGNSNWAT